MSNEPHPCDGMDDKYLKGFLFLQVGLQDGGKACIVYFSKISNLCEYFMDNVRDMKRKPFSISDVGVFELEDRPEPMNKMKGEPFYCQNKQKYII